MKFGVVIFPGSNCDHDCYYVIKNVIKADVDFIWHKDKSLKGYNCIIIPGGFSYGDYLRAGAIARFSPVMNEVKEFANGGGLVLGICNGFQILLESRLLPGAMVKNKNLKFICRNVYLRLDNNNIPFTNLIKKGAILKMPIAHAEGCYYADEETINNLHENGQIVFRYTNEIGGLKEDYNPNGSLENIAGICNREGNILGLMPHPERCSEEILGGKDGRLIFESIVSSKWKC